MSQLRLREQLSQLPLPVLVVGGDQDTTVGVENMLADYLALPAARRFCISIMVSAIPPMSKHRRSWLRSSGLLSIGLQPWPLRRRCAPSN